MTTTLNTKELVKGLRRMEAEAESRSRAANGTMATIYAKISKDASELATTLEAYMEIKELQALTNKD